MTQLTADDARHVSDLTSRIVDQVSHGLTGKDDVITTAFQVMLTGGHLLIEDVPGVGKTLLATGLARACRLSFARIQFTADLMPGDITGVRVYQPASGNWSFEAGPIFHELVLADEINRSGPRTQSALLEAMEERRVSVDGTTYRTPQPFFVIATANPVEMDGTFQLPEAQRDRFTARLSIGYLDEAAEAAMVAQRTSASFDQQAASSIAAVASPEDLLTAMACVRKVHVAESLHSYAVRLARTTRNPDLFRLGISPRGVIHLIVMAKAIALTAGRTYVLPDDVQDAVHATWHHRLTLSAAASRAGDRVGDILSTLISRTPAPARADT
ncbi:hypothetical protein BSZ39_01680 [Bowdeniella nasicola]|uniref:MoxR-like ATPase n=1 Tax=Bowdeniella nasicola TaxID=208480 RepID=A0A1Q5Q547_9ACTO|nr:MoxR family ATPase [Bowdeniella nasicola]OKL54911.1 hypothetical protein BSZ39_01680 [Bowdeniella nasicola]